MRSEATTPKIIFGAKAPVSFSFDAQLPWGSVKRKGGNHVDVAKRSHGLVVRIFRDFLFLHTKIYLPPVGGIYFLIYYYRPLLFHPLAPAISPIGPCYFTHWPLLFHPLAPELVVLTVTA